MSAAAMLPAPASSDNHLVHITGTPAAFVLPHDPRETAPPPAFNAEYTYAIMRGEFRG